MSFRDDFEGDVLDRSVWIPLGQGQWCPVEHETPLRVSGVQSGVFSGEVGSTVGQQPFRAGLRVREAQPTQWGWTPHHGIVEVRARMTLTARSMASVWMVGVEDEPRRSGEICIFEVFGDAIDQTGAAVGMGIHPFRDPALHDDFTTPRQTIDVSEFHAYAADWRPGRVEFFVDGEHVHTVEQAPDYPMQMMIGLFDFPTKPLASMYADHVPLLVLDYVREA